MGKRQNEEYMRSLTISLSPAKLSSFAERVVAKLNPSFQLSSDVHYAFQHRNNKISVKVSRAFFSKKKDISNYLDYLSDSLDSRLYSLKGKQKDLLTGNFLCNIQQIREKFTDVLWYGVFFEEGLYLFKSPIKKLKIASKHINFMNYQHIGSKDEGQFHITSKNFSYHIEKNLTKVLTYDELYSLAEAM